MATIKIAMNGSFEVLDIFFADNHTYEKNVTGRAIKEAFADAQQKIKESLMKKMKTMQ